MPEFTNQYLAAHRDPLGNRCEAIFTLVQTANQITGAYAFRVLKGRVPDGWGFPATNASVEGEYFSSRRFPFQNASVSAIRAAPAGTGLHARLNIGGQTFYALMLDAWSRGLMLRQQDDLAAIERDYPPDFSDTDFDIRDEAQTTWRAEALVQCLAKVADSETRAKLERLAQALEQERERFRKQWGDHLAKNPRHGGSTVFSGVFSYGEEHSYTGNRMEATLEIQQSTEGRITGRYRGPSETEPFVNWSLPMGNSDVEGEVIANRQAWRFATENDLSNWKSDEEYLGLPGGPLEARIAFAGETFYLLRTVDGQLHLFVSDDILGGCRGPWLPQKQQKQRF